MGYVALAAQVAGQIMKFRQQEKDVVAQAKAIRQQAENALYQMNHEFMHMELERKDNFEQATNELFRVDVNALGLNSAVRASVSEEYGDGGNTANLINRSAEADTLRTKSGIRDNLQRKSEEIDLNKEVQWLSTKRYISSLKMPKLPSRTAALLGIAGTVVGGVSHIRSQGAIAKANGMTYNRWTGRMSTNNNLLSSRGGSYGYNYGNTLYKPTGAYGGYGQFQGGGGGFFSSPTYVGGDSYNVGDFFSGLSNIFEMKNQTPSLGSPFGDYQIRSRYGFQY